MNKIKAKLCYIITIITESPLSIGSSINISTDHDIIQYSDGNSFIPGTTLAGCLFRYNEKSVEPKKERELFSMITNLSDDNSSSNDIESSPLFISNAEIVEKNNICIGIRDGIQIEEDNKVTKDSAKYNVEYIEKGVKFQFKMEYTLRENDKNNINEVEKTINDVLCKLNNGSYRIGSNQNRGFGKVSIVKDESYYDCFSKDKGNLVNYIEYLKDENFKKSNISLDDRLNDTPFKVIIKCDCDILGTINVRDYLSKKDEKDLVDSTMLKSSGEPVIPASSINGTLRSTIKKLSNQANIQCYDNEYLINNVLDTSKYGASLYVVEDSIIKGGEELKITRTAIDRFTGGSKNGALFTEKVWCGGKTTISLKFKHKCPDKTVGLFILALNELHLGLTAFGGETSIGRGLISINSIELNGEKIKFDDNYYTNKLISHYLEEVGK